MGRRAPTALALAAAAAIAGCGGSPRASTSPVKNSNGLGLASTTTTAKPQPPPSLRIVASLPLIGPDSTRGIAVENGMRLAFATSHGRAGEYKVLFKPYNDATRTAGWDARAVAAISREAATREGTIAYLGELESGAAQVSIPIMDAAGIPEVLTGSPSSQLLASEADVPGARSQASEGTVPAPFVRLVPSNIYQAEAELKALKILGCTRVAIAYGTDADATDLVAQLKRLATGDPSLSLLPAPVDPAATSKFDAALSQWTHQQVNCAIYAGAIQEGAVAVTVGLHRALAPGGKIIGSSSICTSAWVDPRRGGVATAIDADLYCTAPGEALSSTAAGRQFADLYRTTYHLAPDPAAAYGYEAMAIVLDAISANGPNGDDRDDVMGVLRSMTVKAGPLGPSFSFSETTGDTTSRAYSLYRVANGGRLELDQETAVTTTTTPTITTGRTPGKQPVGKHQPG